MKNVKPILCDDIARFPHQPLTLPRETNPEAAVFIACRHKADASYDLIAPTLESQGPVPLLSAIYRREGHLAIERFRTA